MAKTVFAMITVLEDGAFGGRPDNTLPGFEGVVDPGYGRPIYHPGHPDHGLPGERPDHIGGGPIYHPGHPDHGLPSRPAHPGNRPPGSAGGRPDNSLPWTPGSPDNSLPVPPGVTPPAVPGGALKDKLVVLWHVPGQAVWHGKVIDPATIERPDQGLPEGGTPDNTLPETPAPKA